MSSRAGLGHRVGRKRGLPAQENFLDLNLFPQITPSYMHYYNATFRWKCPPTHLFNIRCKINRSICVKTKLRMSVGLWAMKSSSRKNENKETHSQALSFLAPPPGSYHGYSPFLTVPDGAPGAPGALKSMPLSFGARLFCH